MTKKTAQSLDIKGTLTFEPSDPPRPLAKYVIQKTAAGCGNVAGDPAARLQVRAHVIPTDPQTAPQLARRATFAAAVAAWQALSSAEKQAAKIAADKSGLPAYQWFIGRYLRDHS